MMGDIPMQCISSPATEGTTTMGERKSNLMKKLTDISEQRIALYGDAGVGKTWLARETSNLAKKRGKFHLVIWFSPYHIKYENGDLLYSIGRQLSLPRTSERADEEDDDDFEDPELKNNSPEGLKGKIMTELATKKILLVMDDVENNVIEGNVENDANSTQSPLEDFISNFKSLLNLNETNFKVLITTRSSEVNKFPPNIVHCKVEPMHSQDALKLLCRRAGIKNPTDKDTEIVKKTRFLPPAIILMAKIRSSFEHHDSGEELLNHFLMGCESSDVVSYLTELLRNGYNNSLPASVLIDCCWKDNHFFRDRQSVHYTELIAHWMLEGYLGPIDFMEKTYEKGHHILMELMDCQILRKVETDHVAMVKVPIYLDEIVPTGETISLGNNLLGGYGGTAKLGLASVFQVDDWTRGFGRIFQKDGTMTTAGQSKQGQQEGSFLLIDGNCLDRAAGGDLFKSKDDHEVIGLINPTYTSWPPSTLTDEMNNLRILVMRGCDFLHEITLAPKFGSLTVLEISGAISLTKLADDFFNNMPEVRSINFSGLQIMKLPTSLYGLHKLSWLILRNCSKLTQLDSLKNLMDLMVLDLCDASSLEELVDKNFSQNAKIQTLNLSGTKIRRIPLLKSLRALTHLLLKGCPVLGRLCSIRSVTSLQIIDLSRSKGFQEFHDQSLDGMTALEVLNVSETDVNRLPSNTSNLQYVNMKGCNKLITNFSLDNVAGIEILDLSRTKIPNLESKKQCNVRQLLLSGCIHLKELPDLTLLTNLEVLDLSGCTSLTMIPEKSFLPNSKLQKLDVSKTKIKQLPSISHLSNLLYLSLDGCTTLASLSGENTSVEEESDLSSMEELNSTGNMVANFLGKMNKLQYLNLSKTNLKLPSSLLNITDLRELYLRGCKGIDAVPNLENFTKLEILDLSGSGISQLPSFMNLRKLRQLLLADCFSLQKFQVGRDHLLGMGKEDLPYDISTLSQLEQLVLPSKNNTNGLAVVLNQCDWIISVLPLKIRGGYELPFISGFRFAQLLKTDHSLWKERHLSAIPFMEPYGSNVLSFNKDHYAFRDIYFKTRHFDDDSSDAKSLEIRGFKCLPPEMEQVLKFADFVFLIDNKFQPQLSDFKNSKGCWIERCQNIDLISDGENHDSRLEVLWVSNATELEHICNVPVLPKFLENLTHLYLEFCPKLSSVFPTCQLPVNLKVIQIKFCDALENILGEQSKETEFRNLKRLHLLELPKLERIGGKFPCLEHLLREMCPKLPEFQSQCF